MIAYSVYLLRHVDGWFVCIDTFDIVPCRHFDIFHRLTSNNAYDPYLIDILFLFGLSFPHHHRQHRNYQKHLTVLTKRKRIEKKQANFEEIESTWSYSILFCWINWSTFFTPPHLQIASAINWCPGSLIFALRIACAQSWTRPLL